MLRFRWSFGLRNHLKRRSSATAKATSKLLEGAHSRSEVVLQLVEHLGEERRFRL
jgi:hypothetical protein